MKDRDFSSLTSHLLINLEPHTLKIEEEEEKLSSEKEVTASQKKSKRN